MRYTNDNIEKDNNFNKGRKNHFMKSEVRNVVDKRIKKITIEIPTDTHYVLSYHDEKNKMDVITGDCPICHQFPCKHIDTSMGDWKIKKLKK